MTWLVLTTLERGSMLFIAARRCYCETAARHDAHASRDIRSVSVISPWKKDKSLMSELIAKNKRAAASKIVMVEPIRLQRATVNVFGVTPLIMHRFSSKSWQQLLLPAPVKNKVERAQILKHDPMQEYRECQYRNRDPAEPTLLHYPSGAFSGAIADAALDLPGVTKAKIQRLVSVASTQVNVYGLQSLGMDMVRLAGSGAPDVRTRPYLREWCCSFTIEFAVSLINLSQIMSLVEAAGRIIGLGDYRPQKGGSYGKFVIMPPEDEPFQRVMRTQGRAAQEQAYMNPTFYSEDAEELYGWYVAECERREKIPESMLDGDDEDELPPLEETPPNVSVAIKQRKARSNSKRSEVLT
jgi:hypothetical protein